MNLKNILKELNFKAIRSSGAGGQHVNKVSSKIALAFNVDNSTALSDKEKTILLEKLATKLSKENTLTIICEATRSQHKNKEIAIRKFVTLIKTNLIQPKKRRPTKPTKGSLKRKSKNKKRASIKKGLRKKPLLE